ncbi:MAG: amidohydrolase [Bacillota bacterium]|nr:amidohydrolase [Eubacteriales bacterium]MDI9491402.1 amidohydrolase [Bacillota bacterium]NLV70219.1 amidohydrolase [Clostridiales bacterium]
MKTAFVNGKIRTVDRNNSVAEAMLVADGKIEALGSTAEIRRLAGGAGRETDLAGCHVLPAFIDTHLHMMDHGIYGLRTADLYPARSVEDVVRLMQEYLTERQIPEGQWLEGFGWDQDLYPGTRFPTCRDLDRVSLSHPIMITRRCGTICSANSLAMKLAGIDRHTPDPAGGEIRKDVEGEPDGVMLESAMSLIGGIVPKLKDKETIKEILSYSARDLVRHGILVAHTEDFMSVGDKKTLMEAYLELQEEGRMPMHLVLQLRIHKPGDLASFFEFGCKSWETFGRIKIGPIKFLGDGSLGAWTAGLNEPYDDNPGERGLVYYNLEELKSLVATVVKNDFDLTIHSIGDRSTQLFLEACLVNNEEIRRKGFRPSVIHSQIMNPKIFELYRQTGAIAIVQPMYVHSDWKIADARVGRRMEHSYCFRKMRDAGIPMAAGSDLPIESVNPFHAIQVSVTRKDLEGQPEGGWYPEEKLDRLEALKLHTVYGAGVSFDENRYGSLEPEKQANFILVSDDLFAVEEDKIKDIRVLATYLDGEPVYTA